MSRPSAADVTALTALLGREPRAEFDIAVRAGDRIIVIRNAPFLADGTPMPTRYWLVDTELTRRVAALESLGGVKAAERVADPAALARAHREYAAERERAIPPDRPGPRPAGGVGGTRRGVKCLHAHYAYWLAGGRDPVGAWVAARLADDDARA